MSMIFGLNKGLLYIGIFVFVSFLEFCRSANFRLDIHKRLLLLLLEKLWRGDGRQRVLLHQFLVVLLEVFFELHDLIEFFNNSLGAVVLICLAHIQFFLLLLINGGVLILVHRGTYGHVFEQSGVRLHHVGVNSFIVVV